jgi:hypothetical protein
MSDACMHIEPNAASIGICRQPIYVTVLAGSIVLMLFHVLVASDQLDIIFEGPAFARPPGSAPTFDSCSL